MIACRLPADCENMQDCAVSFRNVQKCAEMCRIMQVVQNHADCLPNAEMCRLMQNYAAMCRTMQNYAEICRNMQNDAEICRNMKKYAEIFRRSTQITTTKITYIIKYFHLT